MTGHSQFITLTHRNTTVIMNRMNYKQATEVLSVTEQAGWVRQTY